MYSIINMGVMCKQALVLRVVAFDRDCYYMFCEKFFDRDEIDMIKTGQTNSILNVSKKNWL